MPKPPNNPDALTLDSAALSVSKLLRGLIEDLNELHPLIEDLANALPDLMFRWSPHRESSDYVCVFCDKRAEDNNAQSVIHDEKCLGVRLLGSCK